METLEILKYLGSFGMEQIDVINAEKVLDDPSIQISLKGDDNVPQNLDVKKDISRPLISKLTKSPFGRFSFRITK